MEDAMDSDLSESLTEITNLLSQQINVLRELTDEVSVLRSLIEENTVGRDVGEDWDRPECAENESIVGSLWARLLELPRQQAATLTRRDVPSSVGVYVWFREGSPIYSGRAKGAGGIQGRVWDNHMKTGPDLSRSSFRRNVCDHLGIANTSVSKARPTKLTPEDVQPVNEWIRQCEVSWLEFDTGDRAEDAQAVVAFEADLHQEWRPPLSKR